ncbi:MAG: hypothetical protein M1834_000028 [Cirrosporium novae-zelandiae]|nr:MAG: hypothetical protein M1834_000028 [Cirrosporium novae-zelandiae]
MSDHENTPGKTAAPAALHAHADSRAIIRLIQCPKCSLLLRIPMTFPCGNSLCRSCLPPLHPREHISYPLTAERLNGFTCPFDGCRAEHSLGDCSLDISLAKVMNNVISGLEKSSDLARDTQIRLHEEILPSPIQPEPLPPITQHHSKLENGDCLVAAYALVIKGELKYDAELAYSTPLDDDYGQLDFDILNPIKETVRSEFDCQVCSSLILDPLTTPCGHTFCRKCVARVLDHSDLCPVCRRHLSMAPGAANQPTNKRLSDIVHAFWPYQLATRIELAAQEEASLAGGANVPLFVCTLAFPTMPTFLHIFEPRYRLMIRRAFESGDRKFGMLLFNKAERLQGNLGLTPFLQYGTMLYIEQLEMLPDGRSLIETVGMSKFKVVSWSMVDGYIIGNVSRVDDIPLAEEENLEAQETGQSSDPSDDTEVQIDITPTGELLKLALDFIAKMRASSEPWLHQRILAIHGQPPEDPALFPYWFASVLPISDEEKYALLPSTSVRERLKIIAHWIRRIESNGGELIFFSFMPLHGFADS